MQYSLLQASQELALEIQSANQQAIGANAVAALPFTAPGGAPGCIGSTKLTGGKFGENFPSLIKRLGAREK
jgi:hypothetical protein